MSDSSSDTRDSYSSSEAVAPPEEEGSMMRTQGLTDHHAHTQVKEEEEEEEEHSCHGGPTPHGLREDAKDELVAKMRANVAEKMNPETLICPIASFFIDYGPAEVKAIEITRCRRWLVSQNILVPHGQGNSLRWTYYLENPSAMSGNEPVVFNDLKKIFDKIFEHAATTPRGRGNNYVYAMLPSKPVCSDISGANQKMDASILEPNGKYPDGDFKGVALPIRFSVVPEEFKKTLTLFNRKTVREQIVGNVHHIMCEDPRRTHMFAITAEDTRMTVWYFSRSHSMKAISFDWVEEGIDTLIHVFLAFAFATPEQLGLDPLVHKAKLIADPESELSRPAQQYIYEIPVPADPASFTEAHSRFFKTIQSISASRPYCLSGRATRIWKAIEIDGPDKESDLKKGVVILKDVWLDEDRSTETENMDRIFEDIETLINGYKKAWGDDWLDCLLSKDERFSAFDDATKAPLKRLLSDGNYKTLFLTKVCSWKGRPSKRLSPEARFPNADIFLSDNDVDEPIPGHSTRLDKTSSVKPIAATQPGAAPTRPKLSKETRRYVQKRPSRFVYKEVCSALHDVGTLGAFMDMMLQATQALQILFCAGWVHRDISSGNILAFNDNGSWKIKLSDLEFAEPFSNTDHHADPRTGTPYFMPYEILMRHHTINYIRNNRRYERGLARQVNVPKDPKDPLYRRLQCFEQIPKGERVTSVPDTATSKIPAHDEVPRYNFQHDLEALWWIVVYFITSCVPYMGSREYVTQFFSNSFDIPARRILVYIGKFSTHIGSHLHASIAKSFDDPMDMLLEYMREQYIARQAFGQIDVLESYSLIHNDFATAFRRLLQGKEDNEDDEQDDQARANLEEEEGSSEEHATGSLEEGAEGGHEETDGEERAQDDNAQDDKAVDDGEETNDAESDGEDEVNGDRGEHINWKTVDWNTIDWRTVDWRTIPLAAPHELTGRFTRPIITLKRKRPDNGANEGRSKDTKKPKKAAK